MFVVTGRNVALGVFSSMTAATESVENRFGGVGPTETGMFTWVNFSDCYRDGIGRGEHITIVELTQTEPSAVPLNLIVD